MRELREVNTLQKVLDSGTQTPTLAGLSRTYGEDKTEVYIKIWLVDLQSSLNLKNKMNESQIDECAFFITSEFYMLNLADINFFFSEIKKGKYGVLYESISTDKIMEFLRQYLENRCNVAEENSILNHDKHTHLEKSFRVKEENKSIDSIESFSDEFKKFCKK